MPERVGGWIQTAGGRRFYPFDPRPEDVDIMDVAHALSNICRFSGHTRSFYSVAEHSVRVSELCPPEDALWGLLHDASEAYIADVSTPVKRDPAMIAYREAEARVMGAVCARFGLAIEMPGSVHAADRALLATEARDLMSPLDPDWGAHLDGLKPISSKITPWDPVSARRIFLAKFSAVVGGTSLVPAC